MSKSRFKVIRCGHPSFKLIWRQELRVNSKRKRKSKRMAVDPSPECITPLIQSSKFLFTHSLPKAEVTI